MNPVKDLPLLRVERDTISETCGLFGILDNGQCTETKSFKERCVHILNMSSPCTVSYMMAYGLELIRKITVLRFHQNTVCCARNFS
jgi:hypothetical protein